MKVVKIKGTPYEMGLEYGKNCKKEIRHSLSTFYLYGAMSLTPGFRSGHPKLRYMLLTFFTYKRKKNKLRSVAAKYEEMIQRYRPEMIEEMRGIAEGAEVDYQDILYINAFPEIVESCSMWVACGKATSNGETLLGMNTDEMKRTEKTQIVLFAEPDDGYRFIGTAYAGAVGIFHGMNQNGLAFASMLLNIKKTETPPIAMPYFVMLEAFMSKCANTDEAIALFKEFPKPSCPSAVFFADKVKAARIEASAEEYDITVIENDAVGCCMRPLSEKMKKYDNTLELDPRMTINAIPRTKRMHELLKIHYGSVDENIMMEIARDHGEGETRGKGICLRNPGHADHRFRCMPTTNSGGACRPPIPVHADH
jgi:isopenicillin-N N-acyltransferase-like protein